MIIAHLRKRGKGDKKNYTPSSDDISGSGAFKQDSTEVLIATRKMASEDSDEVVYGNEGMLYVAKTKCGPNGKTQLMFSDRGARIKTNGEIYNGETSNEINDETLTEIFGQGSLVS
jgi:replicative DNA helicase